MSIWDDFHARHSRQNFTPAFNGYLEALIADEWMPLDVRIGAWMLRMAWGNHSDSPVDENGVMKTQSHCARDLKLFDKKGAPDRRKVNPVFLQYEKRGYIRFEGQSMLLIDDPRGIFAKSSPDRNPFSTLGEEEEKMRFSDFFAQDWGARNAAAYQEYQQLESRLKEIRTAALEEWKARPMSDPIRQNGEGHCPKGSDTASERVRQSSGKGPTIASVSINENGKQKTSSSEALRDALTRYGRTDDDALKQLRHSCRKARPDCSDEEIAHFVHEKGALLNPGIKNPIGWLMSCVPKCLEGDSFREFRSEQRNRREQQAARETEEAEAVERWRASQQAALNDPTVPEAEKHLIRISLGIETERKPAVSEPQAKAQRAGQG